MEKLSHLLRDLSPQLISIRGDSLSFPVSDQWMIVRDPPLLLLLPGDVSDSPMSRSFDPSPTVREEGCLLCSFWISEFPPPYNNLAIREYTGEFAYYYNKGPDPEDTSLDPASASWVYPNPVIL